MKKWLSIFIGTLLSAFKTRRQLALENLVLRQQLAVYKQSRRRPQLSDADRAFWKAISSIWTSWRQTLVVVQPATVIRRHRKAFRWSWTRRCAKHGRPTIEPRIKSLIQRISRMNPLWGAPRIHGELLKLGIEVSESTVSRYMIRHPKPPSQTWRTFLENHSTELMALDFFTVPTATFHVLFVEVILSHDWRKILHTNATTDRNERWIAQQVIEAIGTDDSYRYLVRDRDVKFGRYFVRRVDSAGLRHVVTAAASPWQNAYAERVIGTLRRECTDHAVVLNERHLRQLLRKYTAYYNRVRTHLSLAKDAPVSRSIQRPASGKICVREHCAGLHHEYYRQAA